MGKPITRPGSTANTDRNFEKKVQFYAKVRDVSSLNATKTISKAFPEMKIQQQKTSAVEQKVNCKSGRNLILREEKQFASVLTSGIPFKPIHQHLESTQPVANEKPKKIVNKNGSKKKKEKKLKAAEGPRSCEFFQQKNMLFCCLKPVLLILLLLSS